MFSRSLRRTPMPPLSTNLRDFPGGLWPGCSFGEVPTGVACRLHPHLLSRVPFDAVPFA